MILAQRDTIDFVSHPRTNFLLRDITLAFENQHLVVVKSRQLTNTKSIIASLISLAYGLVCHIQLAAKHL